MGKKKLFPLKKTTKKKNNRLFSQILSSDETSNFPIAYDRWWRHRQWPRGFTSTLAYLPTTSLSDSLSANPTLDTKKKRNASVLEPTSDPKTAAPPPLTKSLCGIERNKRPTPPLSVAHLFDEDRSTVPPMSIDESIRLRCATRERQRWVSMKIPDFRNVLADVSQQQGYFKRSRPWYWTPDAEGHSPKWGTLGYF